MSESRRLLSAREHLARAEAMYLSEEGLFQLEEGLSLLQEVIDDEAAHRSIARNLAATYALKLYGNVQRTLEQDRGIPEPELEHFFKVILAFDEGDFELPAQARAVKIGVARRLIDRYYEGHPPDVKQKALEQLARISGQD